MYLYLLAYPGIVVLHDYVLQHFIGGMTWGIGNTDAYVEEMRYNYGESGAELGRLLSRGIWTPQQLFLFPANKRIIDASLGIIVHSDYIKREIEQAHPGAIVRQVFMGVPDQPEPSEAPRDVKARMGLGPDAFVIGVFGFVIPNKRVDVVVQAFARLLAELPNALLLIVGEVHDVEVTRLIAELKLEDKVLVTGYVTDDAYHDYILATDMAVNLRYPTAGETSASLLDMMSRKVPVVVFDYRQYSEVPDGCCVKIGLGVHEAGELYSAMKTLAMSPATRKSIGAAAARYVQTHCKLQDSAIAYVDFIEHVRQKRTLAIARRQVTSRIVHNLRTDLVEAGLPADRPACLNPLSLALQAFNLE